MLTRFPDDRNPHRPSPTPNLSASGLGCTDRTTRRNSPPEKEKNAILLCHNYQVDPIQQVADYVGDSLGLARKAAETDAEVIVFCGVHFMAETSKILNPGKTVLLPDMEAGCSLSDSCPAEKLALYREKNPDIYVVAYVNCSAAA